jgi:hypothetical protein
VLTVPRSWAQVSPEWLTAALAARFPGAVVATVDVGPVRDGTTSRAALQLSYAQGTGPPSVFVKRPGRLPHRLALLALGALGTEARLAASGVPLPVERPEPYAAGINPRRLATVVVMQDVTLCGGRPNDAVTPLTVAEVRSGLGELARLHAAYWDRPLPPALSFLRPWRLGPGQPAAAAANLGRALRRLARDQRPLGSAPRWLDAHRLAEQFGCSASLAARGPQTLLHGDPHPANTYRLPGARTGLLDWQLARTGHWSHDVGYFLAGSLSVADRRREERQLLGGYLESLRGAGVPAPAGRDAWERYRATPAFGLATWLHTYAFRSFQPADACDAMIGRFAAAYADLETWRSAVAGR